MQHESKPNSLNQTFGVTVYETPEGGYTYRVHSRTYEGIRVKDSWSSAHVALKALTVESAGREASKKFKDWTKAIGAQK